MVPFYILVAVFLLGQLLGLVGIPYFTSWSNSLRAAVAAMLLVTASAHWGKRRPDLIRMVPPSFPRPDWIVTITGWLEIAGAIGILIPATSRAASICLALLMVAMFPANVRAAKEKLSIGGRPVPKLLPRTVLQIVFIAATLLAGWR